MKKICILGGDKRQIELYELLKYDYDVKLFGFELNKDNEHDVIEYINICDVLLLAIPLKIENSIICLKDSDIQLCIDDMLKSIKKECVVLYGGLTNQVDEYFKNTLYSYNLLNDEDFLVKNASLTAKAALIITMMDLNMSLEDLNICVIGYGRIGKELVRLLHAFDANVIICSTKNLAFEKNHEIVHTSNAVYAINKSNLVFNTAPYTIVKNEDINKVDKHVKIIELASRPYGFDIEFLKNAGYDITVLPSLPGKVLYKSAAKILYKKIDTVLEKNNGFNG